jgi:hypothetical protein
LSYHPAVGLTDGDRDRCFRAITEAFLGGEYGQTGDPDAFAATLRQVLTNSA